MIEVLFSPWRLAYLQGIGAPAGGTCLFCTLQKHDDEAALIVHRGATAFIVLNRFPYTNGHLMIVPFAHRGRLAEMTVAERSDLVELASRCETYLTEEYHPHGLNVGWNLGRAAGAGVADHAHLHVVPRWDGDTNFLTVTGGTRTIPEELPVTRRRLAARFGA